jgi:hypothetical protein
MTGLPVTQLPEPQPLESHLLPNDSRSAAGTSTGPGRRV